MKDYYDVWFLLKNLKIRKDILKKAMITTFNKRKTRLPKNIPVGLKKEFYNNREKQVMWEAFLKRINIGITPLEIVIKEIRKTILPVIKNINEL